MNNSSLNMLQGFDVEVERDFREKKLEEFRDLVMEERTTCKDIQRFVEKEGLNMASLSEIGETPLKILLKESNGNELDQSVEFLCKSGAEVGVRSEGDGESVLHFAVRHYCNDAVLKVLIGNHEDPSGLDGLENTPLHWLLKKGDGYREKGGNAYFENYLNMFNRLSQCTDITLCNSDGETPLHIAACVPFEDQDDRREFCKPLITKDIINLPNEDGNTPLMCMVKNLLKRQAKSKSWPYPELSQNIINAFQRKTEFFILQGADTNAVDAEGNRPIDLLMVSTEQQPCSERALGLMYTPPIILPPTINEFSPRMAALLVPDDIYEQCDDIYLPYSDKKKGKGVFTLLDKARSTSDGRYRTQQGCFSLHEWAKVVSDKFSNHTNRLTTLFPIYWHLKNELNQRLANRIIKLTDEDKTGWTMLKKHPFYGDMKALFTQERSGTVGKAASEDFIKKIVAFNSHTKRKRSDDDQSESQDKHQKLMFPQ